MFLTFKYFLFFSSHQFPSTWISTVSWIANQILSKLGFGIKSEMATVKSIVYHLLLLPYHIRYRSRSRRSSANSNGSNTSHSEAESLTNTLTPCNTDSKSSGTEDEGISGPKRCSVCNTPTNDKTSDKSVVTPSKDNSPSKETEEANVTFTVSLPRRPSIEVAEITASISPTKMMMQSHGSNYGEGK